MDYDSHWGGFARSELPKNECASGLLSTDPSNPILHSWSLDVLLLTLRGLCHASLDDREAPGTHSPPVQVRFTSDTDDGAEPRGRSRDSSTPPDWGLSSRERTR
ncbi:hypothetical protein NMY22_g8854 [Coprinellus aureogranulatus]|nr:hypothetical protein NMY22_g8854 [Coprinellus aureogranulatus]